MHLVTGPHRSFRTNHNIQLPQYMARYNKTKLLTTEQNKLLFFFQYEPTTSEQRYGNIVYFVISS